MHEITPSDEIARVDPAVILKKASLYSYMNEEKDVVEIDLWKLLRFYLKKWWIILICGVVAAAAALVFTMNFVQPMYKASVTVYVNNAKNSQMVDYITGSNLSAAQQLVSTYVNIIKSNTVLNRVIDEGDLDCEPEDIRKIMSAQQVDETEMFTVSIVHPDPVQAAHIANTVADVAPDMISNFVEGSSTKIIDDAEVPDHRFTPSYSKNTVLGGLLGVLIAGVALTLHYLFDFRLKDEEDMAQYFDAPVLGIIPSYHQQGSKKKSGYEVYASGASENARRNG